MPFCFRGPPPRYSADAEVAEIKPEIATAAAAIVKLRMGISLGVCLCINQLCRIYIFLYGGPTATRDDYPGQTPGAVPNQRLRGTRNPGHEKLGCAANI